MATVSDLKDALHELHEKYPHYVVGESSRQSKHTVRSWVTDVNSDGSEILLKLSDEETQNRSDAISVDRLYQSIVSLSPGDDASVELCLSESEHLRIDSEIVGIRVAHDQGALIFLRPEASDDAREGHARKMQILRATPFWVFVLTYVLYRIIFTPYNAAEGSRYAEPGQKIIVQKIGCEINVKDLILHKTSDGTTVAEVVAKEGNSSETRLQVKRPDSPTVELDSTQLVGRVVWITDKLLYLILVLGPFSIVTLLYFQPVKRMRAWRR
jgi:hypothetical protein